MTSNIVETFIRENGSKVIKEIFPGIDGYTRYNEYNTRNILIASYGKKNGYLFGPFITYFANGNKYQEVNFVDDEPYGPYAEYEENGLIIETGIYIDGQVYDLMMFRNILSEEWNYSEKFDLISEYQKEQEAIQQYKFFFNYFEKL